MQFNINKNIQRVLTLPTVFIPHLQEATTKVFSSYLPSPIDQPIQTIHSAYNLKTSKESLENFPADLIKAEKREKAMKILSITLLAISVTLIATGILLGLLVNPLCFLIASGVIISAFIAHLFVSEVNGGVAIPLLSEITSIVDAFSKKLPVVEDRQKLVDETTQRLTQDLENLHAIRQQKKTIEEGILREIQNTDAHNIIRFNELKTALNELNQIETFFKLIT